MRFVTPSPTSEPAAPGGATQVQQQQQAAATSAWLVCPGCVQVAGANPVSTSCCSQLYCWECLLRSPTCQCGSALRPEDCRPIDQTAARLLGEITVECPFACRQVMARKSLQDHQSSCIMAPVVCPLSSECHTELLRRDLEHHVQHECAFRLTPCSLCGQQLARADLEAHSSLLCPAAIVPCPKGCGFLSQRQQLEHHLATSCPFSFVPCTYHSAGCDEQIFRQNLEDHLRSNVQRHLELVFAHNQEQNARVVGLEREINAILHQQQQQQQQASNHPATVGFQRLALAVPAIGGVAEAAAAVRCRQWVTVAFVYVFLWWLVPHWLRCIGIFTTAATVWRKRVYPKLTRCEASAFFLNLVLFALEVFVALRLFG